jgi:hypothetical protein
MESKLPVWFVRNSPTIIPEKMDPIVWIVISWKMDW